MLIGNYKFEVHFVLRTEVKVTNLWFKGHPISSLSLLNVP